MAKKRSRARSHLEAEKRIDPLFFSFFRVGKRLQQFNILTNTEPGWPFVRINSPHLERAARYALTRVLNEVSELLSLAEASELIKAQVSSLLHEVRSAWEARTRREIEKPDSSPLESRGDELLALLRDVARSLGRRRQQASDWFKLGSMIVMGDFESDDPVQWRWDDEQELRRLCSIYELKLDDFRSREARPQHPWPVLPIELAGWDMIEAEVEHQHNRVDTERYGPWSKPRSPKEWQSIFGLSWDTLKPRFDEQVIRNKKLSSKSYKVLLEDLPPGPRD